MSTLYTYYLLFWLILTLIYVFIKYDCRNINALLNEKKYIGSQKMSVPFLCFSAKTVFNVKFKWVVQLCKNKSVRAIVYGIFSFSTIEYYRSYLYNIHYT